MTREEASAKLSELVTVLQQGLNEASKLAKEHNLSFDVTVQTQRYGTNYTGHLEVGGSIDAWVSSNYADDDWDSSEC